MKSKYILLLVIMVINPIKWANGQEFGPPPKVDTIKIKQMQEVIIAASRIPISFKMNTMSISLVNSDLLSTMPKTIAADEALKLVPGVRIDNQADGSRLHMSIRGQGILSERGLRGIKVLMDGIPVNDPSGFAPDLYDIDWETVNHIEVIRGPSASFYGGGGAAGVLNILTNDGGSKKVGGEVFTSIGSNGFIKGLAQIDGTDDKMNYRLSYSRIKGDGYRDHTAYWGNNLTDKINWAPNAKIKITQIFILTDYFNQNAEGLSIDQVTENPKQANPDARPFNEYQKTDRITNSLSGLIKFSENHDLQLSGFSRWWKYKETSNVAAQYRNLSDDGGSLQYNIHMGDEKLKNHISIGTDFQWQNIGEYKLQSLKDSNRVESTSEVNLEDTLLLANQTINQSNIGVFIADKLEISQKINITASVRYDNIHNGLSDKMHFVNSESGSANFNNVSGNVGASYNISSILTLYANWGQGFMPPATEELASNPVSFGGFNKSLDPATSNSEEVGIRGFFRDVLYYDITGFYLTTSKDFYRYKLYPLRGNQEVFYGNAGASKRKGLEISLSVKPVKNLCFQTAYTYSDFKYTSPDSIKGNSLPNSPKHQLDAEIDYKLFKHLTLAISAEMQTKWYIYTDVVHKDLIQEGFNLYHARISYEWNLFGCNGEISFFVKNITNQNYMAFTEPDPDGNCYQPGPLREYFGSLKINF
jgi:iron complex outermembrane recepter protein